MADQQSQADFVTPPTTKIVAIGGFPAVPAEATRAAILPHEVSETLRAYLHGKIDQPATTNWVSSSL